MHQHSVNPTTLKTVKKQEKPQTFPKIQCNMIDHVKAMYLEGKGMFSQDFIAQSLGCS
jgi:hypothetical protein